MKNEPDGALIQIDPRSLLPYPANYNDHPPEQIDELARSLAEFGQPKNIVIWQGRIIAGHGLNEAAIKAGLSTIQARDVSHWPQEKAEAFLIADNETARMARPDYGKLKALVEMARAQGQAVPGVTPERLAEIVREARRLAGEPGRDVEPQVDRAAELQEKWQVNPGDIWQLDRHFIICGDCREPETWQRLFDAAGIDKVNGVFTSPPYAEQRKAQYGGVPTDKYVEWWEAVQGNVREWLAGGGSFFVNIKPHCEDGQRVLYVFDLVLAMVRQWGWRWTEEYCWKNSGTPKKVDRRFKNQFEPIYQFCNSQDFKFCPEEVFKPTNREFKGDGRTLAKYQGVGESISTIVPPHDGLAYPGNVIDVNFETATGHQAAFPVALPTFFLKAYSDPGDSWLDPFCGSGTTIIAAHNENRIGLGIEQLEKYCSVILQRFLDATHHEPRRL